MALVEVAGFSLLLPLPSCRTSFQRFGRVRFNIFRSASRDFGVRLLQRPLRPVAAGLRS